MTTPLTRLADAGVSIWLDDLSRERLETGDLARKVKDHAVSGVTTNPTIFAGALADGHRYDAQVRQLAAAGADVEEAVFALTSDDVRNACDVLAPVHEATNGVDGRVSIEVSPLLAHDTDGTIAQAVELWEAVDRPNLLVKIPATQAGMQAITDVLGRGISVNVTLIFGLEQYRQVLEAHLAGLERAREAGHDLSTIHSVASFFVSRVDSEVDARLVALGADPALAGRAGVANARMAFGLFEEFVAEPRWQALTEAGAHAQRPLWASTGVKNPDYRDTMYVSDLTVAGTVNTMPEKTMLAFADHGVVEGDQVRPHLEDARTTMAAVGAAGVDLDDVIAQLEREGVEKFVASWHELLDTVREQLDGARGA